MGSVKNDQLWAMNQPTADGQLLLHSFGEVTAQLIPFVCQFKAFQESLAIPVVLYAVGRRINSRCSETVSMSYTAGVSGI